MADMNEKYEALEQDIKSLDFNYKQQIAGLQASRNRWKELATALDDILYESDPSDLLPIPVLTKMMKRKETAIAALKAAGEWEEGK
jgi:hypothetical protein